MLQNAPHALLAKACHAQFAFVMSLRISGFICSLLVLHGTSALLISFLQCRHYSHVKTLGHDQNLNATSDAHCLLVSHA